MIQLSTMEILQSIDLNQGPSQAARDLIAGFISYETKSLHLTDEEAVNISTWLDLKLALLDEFVINKPTRADQGRYMLAETAINMAISTIAWNYYDQIVENPQQHGLSMEELKLQICADVFRGFINIDYMKRLNRSIEPEADRMTNIDAEALAESIKFTGTEYTWLFLKQDYVGVPSIVIELLSEDIKANMTTLPNLESFLRYARAITKSALVNFINESYTKISLRRLIPYVYTNKLLIEDIIRNDLVHKIKPLA